MNSHSSDQQVRVIRFDVSDDITINSLSRYIVNIAVF